MCNERTARLAGGAGSVREEAAAQPQRDVDQAHQAGASGIVLDGKVVRAGGVPSRAKVEGLLLD
jgi:hypothetical protein